MSYVCPTIPLHIECPIEIYCKDTHYTLKFTDLVFNYYPNSISLPKFMFSFVLSSDETLENINIGLKSYRLQLETQRSVPKKDYVQDCYVYEIINGKRKKCFELNNAWLDMIDNDVVGIGCDYYFLNPESYIANKINQFIHEEDEIEKLREKELDYLCGELDIDPNESTFDNNFRKSFNPWDWFKKYKII